MTNLRKTYEKVRLMKKNLTKILWKTYDELMQNLQRHYRYLTKT